MRSIIGSVALAALGVLAAAHPARAQTAVDVKAFAEDAGIRTAWAEPTPDRILYFQIGATGPWGTRVLITVDLSNVDSSRVEVANNGKDCRRDGDILRCDTATTRNNPVAAKATVFLYITALVAKGGPAGYVTAHVEPVDVPDVTPSDNDSRLDIDIRTNQQTRYGVKVADAQGSVGATVTVPVTVTNGGPDTLRDLRLINPYGGGGIDFTGGDGCSVFPQRVCRLPRIPPDTTKTVNLTFHIRRCYRPVRGDPDYGAPVGGHIAAHSPHPVFRQDLPSDVYFRITVRGCEQSAAPPSPTPSAPPPTAEASSPPVYFPAVAQSEAPLADTVKAGRYLPAWQATGGGLLVAALVLAAIRLRRRRTGA